MIGPYVLDWVSLIVRWAHFVAGVSWIGASFYFVWLDNNLTAPANTRDELDGVCGELWAVHGGGFYHSQKYLTGPKGEPLSENLHWFKWEAYTTWLSGMAMLAIVYWIGASTYLIDKRVLDLAPGVAIAISIGSLIVGWVVYDTLCKVLRKQPLVLGVSVFAFLVLMSWVLFHIFGARAAYIHVGAIIGTIMVANVAHVIIPGQRKMLAQIRAGREPDPTPGLVGKTRSVHNTYFTLPVLFIMISNHYPVTYANPYGWIVLAALGLAGVLVRYFFILTHKRTFAWGLLVAAAIILIGTAIAIAPRQSVTVGAAPAAIISYAKVAPVIAKRCAVCHAARPTQPGFSSAPAGVLLDTPEHTALNAARINQAAVLTRAMPLGNVTGMTDAERSLVGAWIAGGAQVK